MKSFNEKGIQSATTAIDEGEKSPFVKFDLAVQAQQTPGVVLFNNYEQLKTSIVNGVSYYEQFEYTLENYQLAVKHYNELKQVKNILEKTKREIVNSYNAPLEIVEKRLDELIDLVKVPFKRIDTFIKQNEKESKKYEIYVFAKETAITYGLQEHIGNILGSPAFFDIKWLNSSCSRKTWTSAVLTKLSCAQKDINYILSIPDDNKASILAHYYQTLSMEKVEEFIDSLAKAYQVADKTQSEIPVNFTEIDNQSVDTVMNESTKEELNSDLKDFEILDYVANAINPYTGEVITGIDDLLKSKLEEISCILRLVDNEYFTKFLKKAKKRQTDKEEFSMAGKKWTEQEESLLVEEFEQGLSVDEIAKKHNRKRSGILSRLRKKKLIN